MHRSPESPSSSEASNSENNAANKWSDLKDSSLDNAKGLFRSANALEHRFARRLDSLPQPDPDDETPPPAMSREEFEKWEDDLTRNLHFANNSVEMAGIDPNSIPDLPKLAEAMRPLYTITKRNPNTGEQELLTKTEYNREVDNTVEAYAGNFHQERYNALLDAVRASDNPEKADEEKMMERFGTNVMKHIQMKAEYADTDAASYEETRTKFHNAVISSLNDLNNLAEKYGVRRFTVRNFWTSGLPPEALPRTSPVQVKMRFDRDVVEAYYANIDRFKRYAEQVERGVEAKRKYGR